MFFALAPIFTSIVIASIVAVDFFSGFVILLGSNTTARGVLPLPRVVIYFKIVTGSLVFGVASLGGLVRNLPLTELLLLGLQAAVFFFIL